jgi:hypothetical protein
MTDTVSQDKMDGGSQNEPLTDAQFELLLLLVDGELANEPARRREAEALVAVHADARAFLADVSEAKSALREAVLAGPVHADLSRIRGAVMTKLPSEPRPAIVEEHGIWAFLRHLGLGKVSFALGAAVAAAVWLIATSTGHRQLHAPTGAPVADRSVPDDLEPSVIIEDVETDDDIFMVKHGEHAGDATIIWHSAPMAGAKGEG